MSDRIYPKRPIVGVGAVVFKGDKILLIRRANPPLKDEWSIPGGKLEREELLVNAVKREIKEECNILIEVDDLIDIFEYIEKDFDNRIKYHYIVFDFRAFYRRGKLMQLSDATTAKWVDIKDLDKYKLKLETKEMILKAVNKR